MTQITELTEAVLTNSADSDDSSDAKLSDLAAGYTAAVFDASVGTHKPLWRMISGVSAVQPRLAEEAMYIWQHSWSEDR
jgi:hypothetical protein